MAGRGAGEQIVHLLSEVCERKHRRMHELLDGLGLYRGQPSMLRILWQQDGMTQSELAEHLRRCPSTITKTVQRMERAGFVERKPDPGDERLSRVYVTAAGRNIEAALESVWRNFEAQAFAGFSEDEREVLRELLLRVCRNIDGEA